MTTEADSLARAAEALARAAAALEALTAAHLAAVTPSPDGGQHPAAEPPGHVIPPRRRRAARALDRSEAQHILRVRAQHSAGQQRHVRTAVGW